MALIAAQDGPGASAALRAMHGARVAFELQNETDELPVVVVPVDYETREDPGLAGQAVAEAVADPGTVAAIAFPGGPDAPAIRDEAGLAVLDLSPAGAPGRATWSRLVATDAQAAARLAALAGPRKACLASDEAPRSQDLASLVRRELHQRRVRLAMDEQVTSERSSYRELVDVLAEAGCHTLVWLGGARDAATVAVEAADSRLELRLVGSDRMFSENFVEDAGDAAEGARVVCPCIDISTRTDFETQRFVQEYQSRLGVPPTTYAVEGWDAAQRVIDAIREVGPDREALLRELAPPATFDGLGRTYEIRADGESVDAPVVTYEVRAGRWLPERS